jgi:hypothetical protein
MANLRDLSLIVPPVFASYAPKQLMIMNGREGVGVTTGNTCCCWIVPSGTTWATFEVYGSGGDGAGGCCCMGSCMASGNGMYVVKTIQTCGCAFYNICVGMSGCCSPNCCGTCGFPSYVTNTAGSMVACASGGVGGTTGCWMMSQASYQGINCGGRVCGCCGLGDMQYPSMTQGSKHSSYCANHNFPFLSGTYQYAPNTRHGQDDCSVGYAGSGCMKWCASPSNATSWPGGGGANGLGCGGACCWGSWGTPGMVLITYG